MMTNMKRSRDLSDLKDLPKARILGQQAGGEATLRNYKGRGPAVRIRYGLNYLADRDEIFEIRIGDEVALLDWQELQHYLRFLTGIRAFE